MRVLTIAVHGDDDELHRRTLAKVVERIEDLQGKGSVIAAKLDDGSRYVVTDTEGSEMPETEPPLEETIVEAVMRELYGRATFDHWWDAIQPDTQTEILESLKETVRRQLQPEGE